MMPTRYSVVFVLALTAILSCLVLYAGTTRIGPFLGQGPFEVSVAAIVLVAITATAAIAWSFYFLLRGADGLADRQALQSAAMLTMIVAMVLFPATAAAHGANPVAAGLVAVLAILASIAALRCIDTLAQGKPIGFESHWGGLGGGSGGWRLLPPSALALLTISFIGGAVAIAFGEINKTAGGAATTSTPHPGASASPTPNATPTSTPAASTATPAPEPVPTASPTAPPSPPAVAAGLTIRPKIVPAPRPSGPSGESVTTPQ